MKLVFWVFGIQYSAARIKCQYLQAFELMVDTEDMDKEDESENNRVCICRVVCPEVEEEADSLCLSLNENLQWRKQMSTSYLTIPDSCDQTQEVHECVFMCICARTSLCVSFFVFFRKKWWHNLFSLLDHPHYYQSALLWFLSDLHLTELSW